MAVLCPLHEYRKGNIEIVNYGVDRMHLAALKRGGNLLHQDPADC